jgi:hypothetical protein
MERTLITLPAVHIGLEEISGSLLGDDQAFPNHGRQPEGKPDEEKRLLSLGESGAMC